jgi:hypothetical protein
MTDASDLMLRLGRLIWDDPGWTPARSQRAQPRPLAALAPEPGTIKLLLAAVHQSAFLATPRWPPMHALSCEAILVVSGLRSAV